MSFVLKQPEALYDGVFSAYHQPEALYDGVFSGFGEPLACIAPKWAWSELAGACICAPDYVPSPSGTDCLPRTTGADAPPGTVPPTATPAPTTIVKGVPDWALLLGGLGVIVVAMKVL